MKTVITPQRLRSADGQTMVEFALVLPLLAVLLFGIIQFGVVFNHYLDLTDAVRAGARVAAVSRQTTDPNGPSGVATQAVVDSAGDITIDPAKVSVNSDWLPGDDVTVQAAYPYSISLFGFALFSGDLHSTTQERVE
jgi:Flp pilus assembly protein TadG